MKKYYMAMVLIFVLSGLAIAFNISVSKDPVSDNRQSTDLSTIESAVEQYASKNSKLPASLSSVNLTGDVKDRASNYEYKKGVGGKFQLCATFKTDTTKQASRYASVADNTDPTAHKKGLVCFDFEAYGVDTTTNVNYPQSTAPTGDDSSVTVCTSKLPSSTESDYGTITKIDTKVGTISLASGTYAWTTTGVGPAVYDVNCKLSSLAALKVGTEIDIYYSANKTVLAIQTY
jgi:competence protein ComGC